MFKLNFKIALRNIWVNKTSSMINIFGLATGLASCLMLMLYVSYEWSFDKQAPGSAQVYQVMTNFEDADGKINSTGDATGNVIAQTIKQEIPEIIASARIGYGGQSLLAKSENSFKKEAKFADPDILKIYPYEFIEGNPEKALSSPQSVVLTEETAKLLFGNNQALNQTVRFNNQTDLLVTGVIKNLPANSSNRFDFLMPWSFYEVLYSWVKSPSWTNFNWQTIVKLNEGANAALINKKLQGMVKRNQEGTNAEHFLYPLSEKHLYGKFINGVNAGGEITQIYLFTALALGILLVACINFMNMATAKSEKRAKEVGIKKTLGAQRSTLIAQFFIESTLLTIMSVTISIIMVEMLLPAFNHLLRIDLQINYDNPAYWIGMIICITITSLISGSYPALYLSSFEPIKVMKKRGISSSTFKISLRQVLVVTQFVFTIVLIISTMVIYKQISYIRDRPVGYDIAQLAEIPQEGELFDKFEHYRSALLKSGAVVSMSQSSGSISRDGSSFWNFEWPGMAEKDKQVVFNQIATAYDFVKTNGLKMLAGREFSREFASDSATVMLSDAAVKVMGLKNPVGTKVKYHGNDVTVIGVFKDFIWGSPYYAEKPMVIAFSKDWGGQITLRLNAANSLNHNIEIIKRITKEINPAYPVALKFVNELYADKLEKERILGVLSNLFGGLAVFVSCLGLFGLASYSAEQRTKEFGVRKVLGASVANIMQLLSMSFMKMILVSVLIGVPAAYLLMSGWLKNFDFQTTISFWIMAAAVLGTGLIAFVTVSFQAYKAAVTNPVDALKYE